MNGQDLLMKYHQSQAYAKGLADGYARCLQDIADQLNKEAKTNEEVQYAQTSANPVEATTAESK